MNNWKVLPGWVRLFPPLGSIAGWHHHWVMWHRRGSLWECRGRQVFPRSARRLLRFTLDASSVRLLPIGVNTMWGGECQLSLLVCVCVRTDYVMLFKWVINPPWPGFNCPLSSRFIVLNASPSWHGSTITSCGKVFLRQPGNKIPPVVLESLPWDKLINKAWHYSSSQDRSLGKDVTWIRLPAQRH